MIGAAYPGQAYEVHLVEQLKRDPDAGWGNVFAGQNCGVSVDAMSAERATLGRLRLSGADIRERLNDHDGGTNLTQSKAVLARYGVRLDLDQPGPFWKLEAAIREGRGANTAMYYAPVRDTEFSGSETFGGNHRIWVSEGRGWFQDGRGRWHAEEYHVFDPLADARRKGIADGPDWWPRNLLMRSCWRLNVASPGDNYLALPEGWAYFGLVKDTEPHAQLRFGAERTTPFPDACVTVAPAGKKVNVRRAPNRDQEPINERRRGQPWRAWQVTRDGERVDGSRVWYGNQDGTRWIHSANLAREGGDR